MVTITKKLNVQKKCVIKQKLIFQNFKDCLKMFLDHKNDLKVITMMFIQKKLIRLS